MGDSRLKAKRNLALRGAVSTSDQGGKPVSLKVSTVNFDSAAEGTAYGGS